MEDLGVTISRTLNPSDHISKIVGKANSRVGLLFRGFRTRDPKFLTQMFIIYIRPLLEYCSCVWSPWQTEGRKEVEAVQRRFTKRIASLKDFSYEERLDRLGLEPLSVRRLKSDLTETFKMFNGDYILDPSVFFQKPHCQRTRGHEYKIYQPLSHKDPRKFFFSCQVAEPWNKLPESVVVASTSVRNFRNSLSDFVSATDNFMIKATVT